MTIEGTIQAISWHPDKVVKGLPGMSGSRAYDRTIPAHYSITLIETVVSPEGDLVLFKSGETIGIKLHHPKDDYFLKQNMKVRIIDFKMQGDEGGVHTSFKKIIILNGEITQQSNKPDAGNGK